VPSPGGVTVIAVSSAVDRAAVTLGNNRAAAWGVPCRSVSKVYRRVIIPFFRRLGCARYHPRPPEEKLATAPPVARQSGRPRARGEGNPDGMNGGVRVGVQAGRPTGLESTSQPGLIPAFFCRPPPRFLTTGRRSSPLRTGGGCSRFYAGFDYARGPASNWCG